MFGISRQALYQSKERIIKREKELDRIKSKVIQTRMLMPRLGTRKLYYLIKEDLLEENVKIGRDGLFDFLRRENMLIKPKKNYLKTTNSKHWLRKHPNLLANREIKEPEEVFVSDITYVKSNQGTHYLSLVTDAFTRKIMGYKLSNDMRAEHMSEAFKMASKNRLRNNQVIHHSDRGLQYCSDTFQKTLKQHNGLPSMTDGYDCYQNALAERMNGILKQEFLITKCNNIKELQAVVKQSIRIYNEYRPHLALGMKTPNYVHKKSCETSLTAFNYL